MIRVIGIAYSIICYLLFLATMVYAAGFLGNYLVARPIDSIPNIPRPQALLIDLFLICLFMLQQGAMAQPSFYLKLAQLIPPGLVTITRLLFSSITLILVLRFWEPLGGAVWQLENTMAITLVQALFVLGWLLVASKSLSSGHLQQTGLRQAWAFSDRSVSVKNGFVRGSSRQPAYLGWMLVLWCTPNMTLTRLVFSLGMTTLMILWPTIRRTASYRNLPSSEPGKTRSIHMTEI